VREAARRHAEIVAYAASAGVPVGGGSSHGEMRPRLDRRHPDLRDPLPPTMPCNAALRSHLEKQIRLPAAAARHRHGVYGKLARLRQEKLVSPKPPIHGTAAPATGYLDGLSYSDALGLGVQSALDTAPPAR